MTSFRFTYPWLLALLPLLLLYFGYLYRRKKQNTTVLFPKSFLLLKAPPSFRVRFAKMVPFFLRWLACSLLVLAMARPQTVVRKQWFESTGVEVVLSLDTSGSMQIIDEEALSSSVGSFLNRQSIDDCNKAPSRIQIVKQVVKKFVSQRKGDRISVIVFGSKARPLTPLTHDLDAVSALLDDVKVNMMGEMTDLKKAILYGMKRMIGLTVEDIIEMNKTRSEEAILKQIRLQKGSFLFDKDSEKKIAEANLSKKIVQAMKNKKKRSQILILLTDGKHTATPGSEGRDEVLEVAKQAALFQIKIYTIGIGSSQPVGYVCVPKNERVPYNRMARVKNDSFDEDLLKEISRYTGGKFFSASDSKTLAQVYKDINTLEPNRYKVHQWDDTKELELYFLLPLLFLLFLELLLKETIFGRVSS